jgi:pheromone shutdown protein TraB
MNENIEWKNIRFVPVLHNRLEFALEVKRQFEQFKPDHVAVEFPTTLREKILEGIGRLPLLSVIHYEESDGTFIYLLIEPTDGQVEAVRLATAHQIPVHMIDRDSEGYPIDRSPMPDPYSILKIGFYMYCQAYIQTHRNDTRSDQDSLRERTMA